MSDFPSSIIYEDADIENDKKVRLEALRLAAFSYEGKADKAQVLKRAMVYDHYIRTGEIHPDGLPNEGKMPDWMKDD